MNSRQRRRLRRLSERMFKLCDLTRLRIAQDLDKFCSICTEAARRDSDKGGSPLPEHMLKENGERPLKTYTVEASPDVWPDPPDPSKLPVAPNPGVSN